MPKVSNALLAIHQRLTRFEERLTALLSLMKATFAMAFANIIPILVTTLSMGMRDKGYREIYIEVVKFKSLGQPEL